MSAQDSWSIPGVDWETREAIRDAARRSGMPVADWLDEAASALSAERARSGQVPGNRRRARRQIAREIARLQSALEEFEGEDAALLEAPAEGGNATRRADLSEIAAILGRIGERAASKDPLADRGRILNTLRDGVAALSGESTAGDEEPRSSSERVANLGRTIDHLKSRLLALRDAGELGAAARPASLPAPSAAAELPSAAFDLKAALAEIAARQEALDRAGRTADTALAAAKTPDTGTAGTDIAFAAALDGALKGEPAKAAEAATPAEGTGAAGANAGISLPDFAALHEELRQLRSGLGEAARESSVQSLEAGYSHLVERLDTVERALPARDRIDELSAAVGQIGRALTHSHGEGDLARIEAQIGHIAKAIDQLGSPQAFDRRLGEITGALEGLQDLGRRAEKEADRRFGEMERALAGAGMPSGEFVDRLDKRIEELTGRLDRALLLLPDGEGAGDLIARVEGIATRIEATLTQRLAPQAEAVEALAKEVSGLRLEISLGARPAVAAIEAQVKALAKRLDTFPGPQQDGAALGQIEAQVAKLATRIEELASRPSEMDHVDANLAQLESLLTQHSQRSVEAAQAAAREAVKSLAGATAGIDDPLMQGLKQDLRSLQAAAENSELKTRDAIGTVEAALGHVGERLASLEQATRRAGAARAAEAAAARADNVTVLAAARPAESPAAKAPAAAAPAEEAVLELGRTAETPADRRADFIAAARRAARAAAAESASLREVEVTERRNPFARIGDVFKRRRRPLLFAAAAVVLTIAALKLFAAFGERGTVSLAAADAAPATRLAAAPRPAAVPAVAAAASAEARPAEAANPAAPAGDPPEGALAFAAPEAPGRFAPTLTGPATATFSVPGAAATPATTTRSFTPQTGTTVAANPAASAAPAATPSPEPGVGPAELRKAAAAGDPAALFEIASRYADGRIVAQDLRIAAGWYGEAARRGHPIAALRLAALYENGRGVERDAATAASWYQKAAEAGNVRAMHNLAVLFSEGLGDRPDYEAAGDWFSKAAERGIKDSQYNLGVIYARGLGRAQDLVQAYRWFALAAAQGDSDAGARRDDVAKALNRDLLAQARASVQAWKPIKPVEAANAEPPLKAAWAGGPEKAPADHATLVRRVQTLLTQKGFDVGAADGVEGARTKSAVRAAQQKFGLAETGTIDAALFAALAGA